jgi:hypothetical protein
VQSIIAYRNPIEAAMWEGMMSGSFFPVIVGAIVFFAVFLTAQKYIVDRLYSWSKRGAPTNINLAVSAGAALVVIWYMLSKI